jgi:hypothetical protein
VFAVDGGPWEGPISWRKPILFGFSFGVTVITLTWFLSFMKVKKATGWIVAGVVAIASVGEVFLVAMQKWRGVESHFNDKTAFDEGVFTVMGLMVFLLVLTTVFLTVRSFGRLDAPPSLVWGIRLGLLLLLVSQSVGMNMIAVGGNTFGSAGPLKVPHAVTLHAAQVLPALALFLRLAEMPEERRLRLVRLAAGGYAGLIGATMIQTYGGRSTFDMGIVSSVVALIGLGLLGFCGLVAILGRWNSTSSGTPHP